MKMKQVFYTLFCIASVICFCGCDQGDVNKVIQSATGSKSTLSPRATVQGFINRCQAGDMDGVRAYFSSSKTFHNEGNALGLSIAFENARISNVEESIGSATVFVNVKNAFTDYETKTVVFSLSLENGDWKITDFR